VKIDVQSEYGVVTKILKIDETISDGFIFVMNQDKVKSNIKCSTLIHVPAKPIMTLGNILKMENV
jgi:hypothetical protein